MCTKHCCSSQWCDNDRCTSCIDVYKFTNNKVYNYFSWNKYVFNDYEYKEDFYDEFYCKYDYEKDYLDIYYNDNSIPERTDLYENCDDEDYSSDDYVDDNVDIMVTSLKFMYT